MHDLTFNLLVNLASVCNPDSKEILWQYVKKYAPNANREESKYLDQLIDLVINYYNDFVKTTKSYLKTNKESKKILEKLYSMLNTCSNAIQGEELQSKIYEIGMEVNYSNLKDYFAELYQILLGQKQGPRLGPFFILYGIEETKKLIKEKIDEN